MPEEKKRKKEEFWSLTLFVAGKQNPKSMAAYANLKRICEEHLPTSQYSLQVIDISTDPETAISEDILAIPTLLRKAPPPKRRVIGDLSDTYRVLVSLGVQPLSPSEPLTLEPSV